MPHDDYTSRERAVRIRLDATASRPPGRRQAWTVQTGYWHANAPTEKAAADALAAGLHQFLTQYEPARLLTFRGYTVIVELDLGAEDGSLTWHRRTVSPDGRVCLTSFRGATWAEAEADTRRSLAQQSTDWHDDASVHAAAATSAAVPAARTGPAPTSCTATPPGNAPRRPPRTTAERTGTSGPPPTNRSSRFPAPPSNRPPRTRRRQGRDVTPRSEGPDLA